ncbi:MAG: DUF748 domain-containing protein [Candidatus Omnitrophica bacterium]|nr:DUF748 domain-containing protein [Candidatus Omnitrophota bacterium]
MAKRAVLIIAAILLLLTLAGSVGLWFFLSSWVPTTGKARLIQEIERRAPAKAAIGAVRYEWLGELVLSDVSVTSARSGEVWFAAPQLRVRLGWLALALRRQAVFTIRGEITAPAATILQTSGRYDLSSAALQARLRATPAPITSLAPWLRRLLPPPLTAGNIQLDLRGAQSAGMPLALEGTITVANAEWLMPPGRITGDVAIEGRATAPSPPEKAWAVDANLHLTKGQVDGFERIGPIAQLEATARHATGVLTISRLTGSALGSSWQVEGSIGPTAYELLITSQAAAARLLALAPELAEAWQPEGTLNLRAVCRGALQAGGLVDCLANAGTQQMTLSGERLPQPLEQMTGEVEYDALTKRLAIHALEARLLKQPIALSGEATFAVPLQLALDVRGTLPLQAAAKWLPPESAVTAPEGLVKTDLHIEGTAPAFDWTGQVDLHEASFTTRSGAVKAATGVVLLTEDHLTIEHLALRFNDEPLTLIATLTPSPLMETGRSSRPLTIDAALEFAGGDATVSGRLTPKELLIDEGTIRLDHSRLELAGSLSRLPRGLSRLTATGNVELSELSRLPFVKWHALEKWHMQGPATIEAAFHGDLADWPGALVQARLRAQTLRVQEIPLEQLLCTIDQQQGVLRGRIPSAMVGGGKLIGEVAIEHQARAHRYLLQADLAGLQLDYLTRVVPAWRQRAVTGQASSHLTLSGIWERRATWQGEGWLNADGQQLGNIPLLDKLFRGLFGVLADRMGLDLLRSGEVTKVSASWQLSQERFHTEDLRLGALAGTEPVAIYARGSVGMDQTLDFIIDPELSESTLLQAPTTSSLAGILLKAAGKLETLRRMVGRHTLTGTIKEPKYRFEIGRQELLKEIEPQNPAGFLQDIIKSLR